jgi:hypothetical protein
MQDQAEQQFSSIVSLKAKASSGSNIDYNTTPKSIEKDRVLEQV